MTIQISESSFIIDASNIPPPSTVDAAELLLEKFNADLDADKFDQDDESFDGYEYYLLEVIKRGGLNSIFPPYPKLK